MKPSTRTVLLAQLFISGIMASAMSLYMGVAHSGMGIGFLPLWGKSILMAWPVAFVLSLGIGPLAFWLAYRLQRLLP